MVQTGIINERGEIKMYKAELNEFCKKNKGRKVIMTFEIVPQEVSAALKTYYYKVVVPAMQSGFTATGDIMTLEQTEERMRELSPVMQSERVDINTGKYISKLLEINEVGNQKLIAHIEQMRIIAAEEFCISIPEPREYVK